MERRRGRWGRRPRWKWWAIGFFSALFLFVLFTFSRARVVYSEVPQAADLVEFRPVQVSSDPPFDVIVCLAGGRGRIRRAIELFEQGYGQTLYISGIDRQVPFREILREIKWFGPIDESRIILERESENTIQNAIYVRRYLDTRGLSRVLLVTSLYHARRAAFIFGKVLPRSVQIEFAWLEQGPFVPQAWWKSWNGSVVTLTEFFKFYYAYLVLTFGPPPLI